MTKHIPLFLPIRQGVRRCFGGFAQGIGRGLSARHDHRRAALAFLGLASSPAFVRAPKAMAVRSAFTRGSRRVRSKPVSHKPQALHRGAPR